MAPCWRFAPTCPLYFGSSGKFEFLWTIDLYTCNICASFYELFLLQNVMNKNKQVKTLFNSEKLLIVLLGTQHYASCHPLASYTLAGSSGPLLETLQHIAGHVQSSPQIGQAQVCLQKIGLVPCLLSSRSTLGQGTAFFLNPGTGNFSSLGPHGTLGSASRLPACDPTATFKWRRLLDMCSTMYLARLTCPF